MNSNHENLVDRLEDLFKSRTTKESNTMSFSKENFSFKSNEKELMKLKRDMEEQEHMLSRVNQKLHISIGEKQ